MGLTPTGLQIKRLEEILQDLKDRAQNPTYFGPTIAVGDDTPMGHILSLVAVSLSSLWDLSQLVYDSRDPYGASGTALDNLALIVGVTREPARKSTVTLTCTGVNGTVIPLGSIAKIPDGTSWITTAGIVIGAAPTDVAAATEETGPIEAATGTITEIVTAIVGWASVTNAADAAVGRDIETDEDLRIRREGSLQATGAGTDQAIAAHVDALDTVDAATCISNRTLVVDALGIPGKSFRVVVWPSPVSVPADVAEQIWDVMPAGIYSDGTEVFSVTDDQGYVQTVRFSYATEIRIWATIVLTYDSTYGGDAAVDDAVVAYGATLSVGDDVSVLDLLLTITGAALDTFVAGIVTIVVRVSKVGVPGPADIIDIPIDVTEIATIDTADVLITSAPA